MQPTHLFAVVSHIGFAASLQSPLPAHSTQALVAALQIGVEPLQLSLQGAAVVAIALEPPATVEVAPVPTVPPVTGIVPLLPEAPPLVDVVVAVLPPVAPPPFSLGAHVPEFVQSLPLSQQPPRKLAAMKAGTM